MDAFVAVPLKQLFQHYTAKVSVNHTQTLDLMIDTGQAVAASVRDTHTFLRISHVDIFCPGGREQGDCLGKIKNRGAGGAESLKRTPLETRSCGGGQLRQN